MRATTRSSTRTQLVALVLAACAFAWTYYCGRRGFFPLDASVVLDGAWRLVCGQIPYAEGPDGFRAPYGLSAFALGALWIEIFGRSFAAWLALSCVLAAIATFVTTSTVGRMSASLRLAALAGALVALWLQAPFGLPFLEQTAFFFGILALACVVREDATFTRSALAGVLWVLAILAKQNTGACIGLALATAIVTRAAERRRAALAVSTGALVTVGLFLAWLAIWSSPREFLEAAFVTPRGLLLDRLDEPLRFASWLVIGKGNWVARGALLLVLVAVLTSLRRLPRSRRRAAWLVVALVFATHCFNAFTNNRPENGYAFAGWIVTLALVSLSGNDARTLRSARRTVVVASVVLVCWGAWSGVSRRVHDPLRKARFTEPLDVEGWTTLRWGEPTRIGGLEVRRRHVEDLYRWLARDGRDFFVFPEFSALYAMLGRTPPQPLSLFHPKSSFRIGAPEGTTDPIDARIVESLETRRIEVLVLEDATWIDRDYTLSGLPRLRAWIDRTTEATRIGPFQIRIDRRGGERRPR